MTEDSCGHDQTMTIERSDAETREQGDPQSRVLIECPYIDTIDRKALDFDFEKLCSVSLSKVNVYACLVCGKYFQGRGKSTHAFIHSVNEFHHIFLNLETLKFYCLPDNYEVKHPSLDDILHVLRPRFSKDDIDMLDRSIESVKAYDGKLYYPGIVGLNNLKYNDYCNVIFQALSHVIPLRNHFLIESNYMPTKQNDKKYILAQRFGELIRKLWNPRNFKAHVSPHEMLQAIVLSSKKRFEFTKQSDPIVFLGWFLNSLMGPKRARDNIIERSLQGEIRVFSRLMLPDVTAPSDGEPVLLPAPNESVDITSFLYLTLDLPAMPLFPKKDEKGKVIKPIINILDLFEKFDGRKQIEHRGPNGDISMRRYEIAKLPEYLILYHKRFARNNFFIEKNTHLVDFPTENLDLGHLLTGKTDTVAKYNLIANIVHDGEPEAGKGTYRVHVLHRPTNKWFELQDLYVTELADTTLITLSECYIQIWQMIK